MRIPNSSSCSASLVVSRNEMCCMTMGIAKMGSARMYRKKSTEMVSIPCSYNGRAKRGLRP